MGLPLIAQIRAACAAGAGGNGRTWTRGQLLPFRTLAVELARDFSKRQKARKPMQKNRRAPLEHRYVCFGEFNSIISNTLADPDSETAEMHVMLCRIR